MFRQGTSKITTQGGIFDLNMYIVFDCAGIVAFWKTDHHMEIATIKFGDQMTEW